MGQIIAEANYVMEEWTIAQRKSHCNGTPMKTATIGFPPGQDCEQILFSFYVSTLK